MQSFLKAQMVGNFITAYQIRLRYICGHVLWSVGSLWGTYLVADTKTERGCRACERYLPQPGIATDTSIVPDWQCARFLWSSLPTQSPESSTAIPPVIHHLK
jgi:hypothetical protein